MARVRLGRTGMLLVLVAVLVVGCDRKRRGGPRLPPLPVPTVSAERPIASQRGAEEVVAAIGPRVRRYWEPLVRAARLTYPPKELALLAFKHERRLELWGRADGAWSKIDALPILAASGGPGPKLRQGDRQVPEGFYRVIGFNPQSRFHLSMMLDYPNLDDLTAAATDGRTNLGGDIFIHGDALSIGCLAIGDAAIENVFVLVAEVGIEHVQVVIAPHDPRGGIRLAPLARYPFTAALYQRLEDTLVAFGDTVPCDPMEGAIAAPSEPVELQQ